MKRFSLYISPLFWVTCIIFMSSCSKSFLEKSPSDKLTPQTFFASEQDLELYAQSFYHRQVPGALSIVTADAMGDYTAKTSSSTFIAGNYSSMDEGQWNWTDLRNVNYFLKHFNNEGIPKEARNHYEALARFFRAYFYFEKVKAYGDVPWYSTPIDVEDHDLLFKPRDPRSLVMDSVLADLDFAGRFLRDQKDASSASVTRQVALAFKSRVSLFEGTFRKNHPKFELAGTADDWLQVAANAAEEVMKSGQYSLYTTGDPDKDYRHLFIQENAVSQEVMWAFVHNNSLNKWHNITWQFNSATNGSRWSLIRQFVNTYKNADGTNFTDLPGHGMMQFAEELNDRDPRLAQTVRAPGYKRSDGTPAPPNFSYTPTGYHIHKFSMDDKALDSKAESFNTIPLIRYAEVLLNYAEAKAELGQMTPEVWNNTIGKIRERVGLPATVPTETDNYLQQTYFPEINDPILLEIRRERGIELVFEGLRYADLLRWKKGDLMEMQWQGIYVPAMDTPVDVDGNGVLDVSFVASVPNQPVPGVFYYLINGNSTKLSEGSNGYLIWRDDEKRVFEDRKYLRPISNADRVLNPNLEQNPGWE